jgi:isoleucyl-tRNA synthetase
LATEVIWRGLTGGESVHLADWPAEDEVASDAELADAMDEVRTVCSTVLSLRKAQNLRVRLPLSEVTIAAADAGKLEPFADVIADEVNVKKVDLTTDVAVHGRFDLVVNARAAGPRLGKKVQEVIKAVKAGDWTESDGVVTAAGVALLPEEYTQRLVAAEPESTAALPGNAGLVVLNSVVTEELAAEGWARDVIRELQEARKRAGLDVSDRIHLVLDAGPHTDWADTHRELIAGEVLATELELGDAGEGAVDLLDGVRARLTKR